MVLNMQFQKKQLNVLFFSIAKKIIDPLQSKNR